MKNWKGVRWVKNNLKSIKMFKAEYSLFWIILVIFVAFSFRLGSYFYSANNIITILEQASLMAILVLGVTWVIGSDEMDASFPDVAACASMVFAITFRNGMGVSMSIIAGLLSGLILGFITSYFVVKHKFNSLITTIAVSTIAKSVASALNSGMPMPLPGIKSTLINKMINGSIGGVSTVIIITIVLYAVLYFLQEKTKFGQYIYAMSENRQAVTETGIRDRFILSAVFINSAFFAALGGIIMVFVVYGSGQPKMGSAFFLDGFTTVFLGAMILKLGKTNVLGTLFGAILLAVLVNGLTMIGATFALSQSIKGILLVIGVAVVARAKKKKRGKMGVLKYE